MDLIKLLQLEGEINRKGLRPDKKVMGGEGVFPRDLNINTRYYNTPVNASGFFAPKSAPNNVYLDKAGLGAQGGDQTKYHEFEHTQQHRRKQIDPDYFNVYNKKLNLSSMRNLKDKWGEALPYLIKYGNPRKYTDYRNPEEALADISGLYNVMSPEDIHNFRKTDLFKDPQLRAWLDSRTDPMLDKATPSEYQFKEGDQAGFLERLQGFVRNKTAY